MNDLESQCDNILKYHVVLLFVMAVGLTLRWLQSFFALDVIHTAKLLDISSHSWHYSSMD